MKKKIILATFTFLFAASLLHAEPDTLIKSEIENGGYIAPVLKFSQINKELGIFGGWKLGWIINHSFSIGFSGNMLFNSPDSIKDENNNRIYMGYMGGLIEYIINPDKLVHFSLSALIGGGGTGTNTNTNTNTSGNSNGYMMGGNFNRFFVAEPEVNLVVNIIKNLRFSVGVGYRFIYGGATGGISDKNLGGVTGTIALQAGIF